MLHLQMCNILTCTQNSFVLIPRLLTYLHQCSMMTLLHHNFCSSFFLFFFCFCFFFLFKENDFNGSMWFKWAEKSKDDHYLIKGIQTKKKCDQAP